MSMEFQRLSEYPAAREKELFHRIKSSECRKDIEQAVEDCFRYLLRDGPVHIRDLHEFTVRLLAGLETRLMNESKDAGFQMRYNILSVAAMDTPDDIKQFVAGYCADLREMVACNERERHRRIINKAIYYMEQECRNASLLSLAKKVYMTPTYLSMLFKMNTGKTFIEQLTDIRINKAKDMLRSTYLKNYEVAEQVGYHDSRYFSQIFKKKVGVSPSEYRESTGR
ncbi:helix-turn-helix transcriptional regulator [Paenibacillus tarimensis]